MQNAWREEYGSKDSRPEGRDRIRQANWKHGQRSAQGREEHREVRRLLRKAKKLSRGIEERSLDKSLSLDEFNPMLEQLTDVESKPKSSVNRLQYLTVWDILALEKYVDKKIDQVVKTFKRIRRRLKHNSHPRVSSATETTEEGGTKG